MSDSELSELSSLSPAESIETDDELIADTSRGKLDQYFKNARVSTSPPPKRKRPASPPHEYVLADNADIAFLVMFRARFSGAFPRSVPNFGPQDIERGVVDTLPDEGVEKLLCALIGLVLNRKKDVERGHHTRALEEAIQTHSHQWPRAWAGKNPLHGGGNFNNMTPAQRLTLLKSLVLWALSSSDSIQTIIKDSYKQQRQEDDLNQPLSVQPWGRDGDKRRYWLIEGQDDTHFRLYRESNPALKTNTWWSIADSIDGIKGIAAILEEDGTQASRRLKDRILAAVPRFEAGEEKRKRRDYRIARKQQFSRPDPGFSLYEGRTRGKRMRYTFSDEEDDGSDATSNRRSMRQSGISTPAEPAGPTFTASGRQVKSRVGGAYGEVMHSGQQEAADAQANANMEDAETGGRPTRSGQTNGRATRQNLNSYNAVDDMEEESDATSSGNEWNGGNDDEDEDDDVDDNIVDEEEEDDEMSDVSANNDEAGNKSLVISLKVSKDGKSSPIPSPAIPDSTMTNGNSPADSIALVGDSNVSSKTGTSFDSARMEQTKTNSTEACAPTPATIPAVGTIPVPLTENIMNGHTGPPAMDEKIPRIS